MNLKQCPYVCFKKCTCEDGKCVIKESMENERKSYLSVEEIDKIERSTAKFMNWFLRHYSTSNEGGTLGYVDSMGNPVSSNQIIEHYIKSYQI